MNNFNFEKMVSTIDNLSTSLDIMLCCKDAEGREEILESCEQLDSYILSFDQQLTILEEALKKEKIFRQTSFQKQLDELNIIEDRCSHMILNFPLNSQINEVETQQYNHNCEIKEYRGDNSNNMTNISNISNISTVPKWNDISLPSKMLTSNNTMMDNTMMGQSLKSQAIKQFSNVPFLKSIDNNEMDTVPKYMKGRLTSLNVNVVIDSINIALENKYEILRKSRNALKKRDQDLYNAWKIQQNNVGQTKYFVTSEDISKFSDTKVDKTTLNIITILRHLKRLKETRIDSFIYYLPY